MRAPLALAVALLAATTATTSSTDPVNHVRYAPRVVAVGAPPAAPADELAPYRDAGNATVYGQAIVEFTGAYGYAPCGIGCRLLLLPDTKYVQWRLAAWAKRLDTQRATHANEAWESPVVGALPAGYAIGDAAIRETGCDATGRYAFHNVPHGRYVIAFAVHVKRAQARSFARSEGVTFRPYDGWLVRSGILVVDDDRAHVIPIWALVTTAHFIGYDGG